MVQSSERRETMAAQVQIFKFQYRSTTNFTVLTGAASEVDLYAELQALKINGFVILRVWEGL